ncbi:hypothetical protein V8E53_010554 [Lactarius tabidus]|jgi:hypothetical protein
MPTPAIALLIVPSFPRASAHLFRNLCGYIICWPTRKAPFLQALLCMSLAIASAVPSFHLSKPTVPLSDCLRIDCWPASRARIYTSAVIYPPSDRVVGRSLTSLASNPISVRIVCGHIDCWSASKGRIFTRTNIRTTSDRVVGHLFRIACGHIKCCWPAGTAPILQTSSNAVITPRALDFPSFH